MLIGLDLTYALQAKRVDNEKRVEELTRELHALRVEKEDMEIRFSYIMKLHQQNEVREVSFSSVILFRRAVLPRNNQEIWKLKHQHTFG